VSVAKWLSPRQKEKAENLCGFSAFSAGRTGLEPAASGVTGRRYNQLNYHPVSGRRGSYHSECVLQRKSALGFTSVTTSVKHAR
jgi:hypothetical protein